MSLKNYFLYLCPLCKEKGDYERESQIVHWVLKSKYNFEPDQKFADIIVDCDNGLGKVILNVIKEDASSKNETEKEWQVRHAYSQRHV